MKGELRKTGQIPVPTFVGQISCRGQHTEEQAELEEERNSGVKGTADIFFPNLFTFPVCVYIVWTFRDLFDIKCQINITTKYN